MILPGGQTVTAKVGGVIAKGKKPNIVLIMADDLGYGDVCCYRATKIQTPHIDKLARNGMNYESNYCEHRMQGDSHGLGPDFNQVAW